MEKIDLEKHFVDTPKFEKNKNKKKFDDDMVEKGKKDEPELNTEEQPIESEVLGQEKSELQKQALQKIEQEQKPDQKLSEVVSEEPQKNEEVKQEEILRDQILANEELNLEFNKKYTELFEQGKQFEDVEQMIKDEKNKKDFDEKELIFLEMCAEKMQAEKNYLEAVHLCDKDIQAQERLANEKGFLTAFRKFNNRLTEINLAKVFGRPDNIILRSLNLRTGLAIPAFAVALGLLPATAFGGAGALLGVGAVRRSLTGLGSAGLAYDLSNNILRALKKRKGGSLEELFFNQNDLEETINSKKIEAQNLKDTEIKEIFKKGFVKVRSKILENEIKNLTKRFDQSDKEFYLDSIDISNLNYDDLIKQRDDLLDRRNNFIINLGLDGKNPQENSALKKLVEKINEIDKKIMEESNKADDIAKDIRVNLDELSQEEEKKWKKKLRGTRAAKIGLKLGSLGIGLLVSSQLFGKDLGKYKQAKDLIQGQPSGIPIELEPEGPPMPPEPSLAEHIDRATLGDTTIAVADLQKFDETQIAKIAKEAAAQTKEQILQTTADAKPKFTEIYEGQMQDAVVTADKSSNSIIKVLQRQLEENQELAKKLGFNPDTDDLSDWANKKANNLAFNQGYGEIGVRQPDKIAYFLQKDGTIKEIDISTHQEIGKAGIMDAHEYKYAPPVKEMPIESTPERPVVPLEQKPELPEIPLDQELPEIAPDEATVNSRILANLEYRYEHSQEFIGAGRDINWVENNATQTIEDYLNKSENLPDLKNNLARLDNAEILERLSESKNNVLSQAALDAQNGLLVKGTVIERINNLLELKSPKPANLENLRNLISEEVEKHIPEAKDSEANLFSQLVGQSKEQFQAVFGKGAVTQGRFEDWFKTFKEMAKSKEMPKEYEFWQPRTDANGRIFNVLRHSKIGGQEEIRIDKNGDGKLDKIIVDEKELQKIMGIKEKIEAAKPGLTDKDFTKLNESPAGTAMRLDENGKPVFEQKSNFSGPEQELSTKTGKITKENFIDEKGRLVTQKNIEANLTGDLAKKAYTESHKVAVDLVYNKNIKNPEQFLERIKAIKGIELTNEEKTNWQKIYKQAMVPNNFKPVDHIRRLTNFIIHPELAKMLAEQQIVQESIK